MKNIYVNNNNIITEENILSKLDISLNNFKKEVLSILDIKDLKEKAKKANEILNNHKIIKNFVLFFNIDKKIEQNYKNVISESSFFSKYYNIISESNENSNNDVKELAKKIIDNIPEYNKIKNKEKLLNNIITIINSSKIEVKNSLKNESNSKKLLKKLFNFPISTLLKFSKKILSKLLEYVTIIIILVFISFCLVKIVNDFSIETGQKAITVSTEIGNKTIDKSTKTGNKTINKSTNVGNKVINKSIEVGNKVLNFIK